MRWLDADMAEHLLVGGLVPLAGERGGNAAVLVGDKGHRADVEFGAAVERAGSGELAAAEADDAPPRLDRGLAGVAHLGADTARQQRALAGLLCRGGGLGVD